MITHNDEVVVVAAGVGQATLAGGCCPCGSVAACNGMRVRTARRMRPMSWKFEVPALVCIFKPARIDLDQ